MMFLEFLLELVRSFELKCESVLSSKEQWDTRLTTTTKCPRLSVMAVFFSSSVGAVIGDAQFSSAGSSLSSSFLVTHGCS